MSFISCTDSSGDSLTQTFNPWVGVKYGNWQALKCSLKGGLESEVRSKVRILLQEFYCQPLLCFALNFLLLDWWGVIVLTNVVFVLRTKIQSFQTKESNSDLDTLIPSYVIDFLTISSEKKQTNQKDQVTHQLVKIVILKLIKCEFRYKKIYFDYF